MNANATAAVRGRCAMLTLQVEHAEAGDGILALRKDLTSLHASHACLQGRAGHPSSWIV